MPGQPPVAREQLGEGRRHPRQQVRRTRDAAQRALAEASRWQRVEVDVIRMVTAGLAVAAPLGLGVWAGHIGAGLVGTIGALMVSSSGHAGSPRNRASELLLSAFAGALGIAAGTALEAISVTDAAIFVIVATLVTASGMIRPSLTKATMQLTVCAIIGTTIAQIGMQPAVVAAWFLAGALGGTALTLLGFAVARAALDVPAPDPLPSRSWRTDLRRWQGALRSPAGWNYPLRLGSCLALAMVFVLLLDGAHSTWVALTVVIVVQTDHDAALARTVQRGLGTVLGVTLGALVLAALPMWALVAIAAVVGAVRGHLKAANYTAYALVMTPLVVIITGLSHPRTEALLAERVLDTVLGCLISLVVGHLLWRRIPWQSPSADPN